MSNVKTDFKYVGTRPVRPDGPDKVTGRAKYGADLNLPGMLHAHFVRSPHAHALDSLHRPPLRLGGEHQAGTDQRIVEHD
jgi:xanthine dehydrogenase molybdopterin-binding subunit B